MKKQDSGDTAKKTIKLPTAFNYLGNPPQSRDDALQEVERNNRYAYEKMQQDREAVNYYD